MRTRLLSICVLAITALFGLNAYSQTTKVDYIESTSTYVGMPDGEFKGEVNTRFKIRFYFQDESFIKREVEGVEQSIHVAGYERELFLNGNSEAEAKAFANNLDPKYRCVAVYRLVSGYNYLWVVEYSEVEDCWF